MNRPNIGVPENGHGEAVIKPQYCTVPDHSGCDAAPCFVRARNGRCNPAPPFAQSVLLAAVEILCARKIVELRELPMEREPNGSDRTVTLLADDDFSSALVGAVRVIDFVAVDEKDDVGVLFDCTRF